MMGSRNPAEGLRLDAHVHLIAIDGPKHGCFISSKRRRGVEAAWLMAASGVSPRVSDEVFDLAYADRLANQVAGARFLDKAILFAMDGLYREDGEPDPRTEALISNEWTREVVNRYPEVFLFGASIHPARRDALELLDEYAASGAVCVKWVPNSQGIDPSDERYRPFYDRMKEHGLVLSSHTGYEHSVFVVDQSLGDPARLRLPLDVGLTVVAGHAGTSGFYHRVEYFPNMVEMCREYENLYADTSALANPVRFTYVERLLEPPLVDRIIQGTDYPVPPTPILWPGRLGLARATRIQATRNPFDRDYLGKVEAGFPEEHFRRGAKVFLA